MRSVQGSPTLPTTLRAAFLFVAACVFSSQGIAGTHTWIPKAQILADGVVTLPPVTVIGNSIQWGAGAWDVPFANDQAVLTVDGFGQLAVAIAASKSRAIDLATSCKNPMLSPQAKSVTSQSDVTARWLAANEMLAQIDLQRLWGMYQAAYGAQGIVILIDNQRYAGFKVTYADGATETWVVTPNHTTSSVKVFDQPAPNSLTAPDSAHSCMVG